MNKRKVGKTVLITGAESGFGAHLTRSFANAGFAVVANCRSKKELNVLKDSISKTKASNFSTVLADIRKPEGLRAIQRALRTREVDILINNAAINPELVFGRTATDIDDINNIFLTNTSAAIALCISAHELFSSREGGVIINMNSVAGLRGSGHEPMYAASKFGLRGFSESVKDVWWKQGVQMIDVYSGAIATGMSSKRPDVDDLIDPLELAEFLVGLCKTNSFFAREINVQKTAKVTEDNKEKIVFTNGVFDLLHNGQLELLKFAKSLGTRLVVGINSDRSTKILKGDDRPIHDEHHRKMVLESLDFVDEVVIFDEKRPSNVVRDLMPHVMVKGGDYSPKKIRSVDRIPNEVEIVTYPIVTDEHGVKISTTAIIEKVRRTTL